MGCQVEGNLLLIYLDKTLVHFRTAFRHQLQTIDVMSTYATDWLPQGFKEKRIHAFGRSEFTCLIESSIEYRRTEIIRRLNQFDSLSVMQQCLH